MDNSPETTCESGQVAGEPAAQKVSSESYYDSDNGFKYYSIINSIDYSGIGLWDDIIDH